ncbi:FolK 7,8-dihydro-6-hydroxymethylpterin-pyrophosphokinase [Rhabdaerophilaceae bacterium]
MPGSAPTSLPALAEISHCFVGLGSNVGDRIGNLRDARSRLNALPGTMVTAQSPIYQTPPWGKTDQDPFANAVLALQTALAPMALLDACLKIELDMGRMRRERWGPRVIDIDLLIYDDVQLDSERLRLPHPAMAERAFVLVPLLDLVPDLVLNGTSGRAMLAELDTKGIERIGEI